MTANEIKIGSWVNTSKGCAQITSIFDTITVREENSTISKWWVSVRHPNKNVNYQYTLKEIKPIELTPDILVKCGFEIIKGKHNIYRTGDRVYQIQYGENNSIFYRQYNPNEYCYLFGSLKYVHQLMNLFYSLTGTELEIIL